MNYTREFTIGKKEQQDYYSTVVMQNWWKGVAGAAVFGALLSWMCIRWMGDPVSPKSTVMIMLLTALLTAQITTVVLMLNIRRQVKNQLRRNGKESYLQQVEINGFGVHVTANGSSAKMGFEKLFRVMETKHAFYIFISRTHAWILPKDQMEDTGAESAQLREIFHTVIESSRLRFLEK